MKEFNYRRAWDEFAKPEFDKLMEVPEFKAAWDVTVKLAPSLRQTYHSTNRLRLTDQTDDAEFPAPVEFSALLKKLGEPDFKRAAYVAGNYGHWGYKSECKSLHGATWMFRIFCGYLVDGIREVGDGVAEKFMDHKPGTSYSNDEIAGFLQDSTILKLDKVISANFRVDGLGTGEGHPFVIGQRHVSHDGGMYIRPERASCCKCERPYAAHHHDEVLLIKGTKDMTKKELGAALFKLKELIESHNIAYPSDKIRVNGFGFPDGLPEE